VVFSGFSGYIKYWDFNYRLYANKKGGMMGFDIIIKNGKLITLKGEIKKGKRCIPKPHSC